MPHVKFAAKIEILLNRVGKFGMDRSLADQCRIATEERLENFVERVRFDIALAKHVRIARRNIELYARNARAVLAPVMLLLHKEKELVKSPQRGAIFFLVVGQRLF